MGGQGRRDHHPRSSRSGRPRSLCRTSTLAPEEKDVYQLLTVRLGYLSQDHVDLQQSVRELAMGMTRPHLVALAVPQESWALLVCALGHSPAHTKAGHAHALDDVLRHRPCRVRPHPQVHHGCGRRSRHAIDAAHPPAKPSIAASPVRSASRWASKAWPLIGECIWAYAAASRKRLPGPRSAAGGASAVSTT